MSMIDRAKKLAEFAHYGQLYGSKDYTYHLEGVEAIALSINGAKDIGVELVSVVSWLHDIIEDTHITSQFLIESGFHKKAVDSIILLTKTDIIAYDEYITNIKTDRLAKHVKIADTSFNLMESVKSNNTKNINKYTKQLSKLVE